MHAGNLLCWVGGNGALDCSSKPTVHCLGSKMGYGTPLDGIVQRAEVKEKKKKRRIRRAEIATG